MNLTFLYVALLYGLTVLVIRRLAGQPPWRVGFFFYLLVLIFLFKPLVGPYLAFGADYYFRLYPWWVIGDPYPGANVELSDVALQFVPWAHQVREAIRNFELPLWSDAAGSGYPLLANGQSSALSMLRWLGIPLSLGHSFAFEAAMKILIALTFAFLYLRRRFSENAAVIGAMAFGFGGFMAAWLLFPHTAVAAFLPALFYAIDLVIEKPGYGRFAFLTAIFSLLLLNGHPETAAHSVFAAGLYVLFWLATPFERRKLRALAVMTAAGIVAIVISLPFLLPFMEALPRSLRHDVVDIRGPDLRRRDLRFLVPLIQPSFYGTIRERLLWGPGMGEFVGGFAGIAAVVAWFAFLPVLRVPAALRTTRAFYLVAAPLFATVALGWPPFADAVHALPLFSMAANARFWLLVCWCLAFLLADLVDDVAARKGAVIRAIVGISVVLGSLFVFVPFPSSSRFEHALITSIPAVLVLLALAAFALTTRRSRIALLVLAAAAGVDLWTLSRRWNPPVPASYLGRSTPLIRELQRRNADPTEGPFRIAGMTSMMFPNTAALYGLEDIRTHDPMANARYLGLLRVTLRYTTGEYVAMLRRSDHAVLDYLNVRYFLTAPPESATGDRWELVYAGPDGNIFRNRKALPRFFAVRNVVNEYDDVKRTDRIAANADWSETAYVKRLPTHLFNTIKAHVLAHHRPVEPPARVRITAATSRRYELEVEAPRWSLIVSSVPHWPGWRAYRDDGDEIKIIEVNEVFIGFLAPPGKTKIVLRYRPRSFYAGLWISLATIAALAGLGIARKKGLVKMGYFT